MKFYSSSLELARKSLSEPFFPIWIRSIHIDFIAIFRFERFYTTHLCSFMDGRFSQFESLWSKLSIWLRDRILIGECMWFFSGNEHIRDFSHVSKVSRIQSRFASGWETIILRPKSVIYKVIFLWNYISPTRKLSKNYSSYNGTSITGVQRNRFNQWFTYESYRRYIWLISG